MSYIKQPPHHHRPSKLSKNPNHEFCKKCGIIFHRGRWQKNDAILKERKRKGELTPVFCPACKKENEELTDGVLTIDRKIFDSDSLEIKNEIRNIEKMEFNRDPLKRIVDLTITRDKVVINTLTKELAVTIGKKIRQSRKGKLEIHYLAHEDFAEVFLMSAKKV